MFMFRNFKHIVLALFFVTLTAQLSQAAARITVEQSGAINGSGMDGVAGIDLTISYDTSLLVISSPPATKGPLVSNSLFTANTPSPGTIRIAVVSSSPFSSSGQIAAIRFASNAGKGGIKSISATTIDSNGKQMPVQASVGASNTSDASTSPTTSTATTPGYIGTVLMQTDTQQTKTEPPVPEEEKVIAPESTPQQPTEPDIAEPTQTATANKVPVEEKTEGSKQTTVFKGIVDRMKSYKGDKSLPILAALFRKEISKFISQEPAVVLSDGKSKIKIIVDLPTHIATSPNFAMNEATLLSVKREAGNNRRWTIEALPEKNAWKSTLVIIAGDEDFEYPLTVAPSVAGRLKLDETGWNAFLKESGTAERPLNDLNQDGVRDHIDEFIFIANYVAATQANPKPSK